MKFEEIFREATGWSQPRGWQVELAGTSPCSRLIRIPTGFGKTAGAALAWLWNRVHQKDDSWPRRLAWCLPMRVLVEQTQHEVQAALERLGLLWNGKDEHTDKVGVHLLMGGADSGDWHLYPEDSAVLIGTLDMLLSRSMNRGYGAARARWPMDFGLLNHDCLWVMDEVQLMDVGLATSGQIQAFREQDQVANNNPHRSYTWWMSATLQRTWLEKSPETLSLAAALPQTEIQLSARLGHLWDDVTKPVRIEAVNDATDIAQITVRAHLDFGRGKDGPTLVVVNTVRDALAVHDALAKEKDLQGTDLRLVHSRFRPHERAGWREAFLSRDARLPGTDRIIVATQVVEAGVDLSATVLVTSLAPWASLVQRFGRAARWGGSAQIIVADQAHQDDKSAAPYTTGELDAAREALGYLADVAPIHLEAFEETHPEILPVLYPYTPKHLLLRHELDELFDTTPDLSGADVDISRFIRSGDERDLQVFWHDVPKDDPDRKLRAAREALCAVPFLRARDWLCGKETKTAKAPRLKKDMHAWVWEWLDGEWRRAERRDLYPGQTLLVAADCGGYDIKIGWAPDSKHHVPPVSDPEISPGELADSSQDDEPLSSLPRDRRDAWQTIAVHGLSVGKLAFNIASVLLPDKAWLLNLAGRWHDAGKAHEAFQNSIAGNERPDRRDLAKAPDYAWLAKPKLYPDNQGQRRGGFRHELVSTLALFAVLQRQRPDHPALLGPWRSFLETAGMMSPAAWQSPAAEPSLLEREILELTADDFDLLAYLVCAHHGKVRMAWNASPADQQAADDVLRIRGIRDGEEVASLALATAAGDYVDLPASTLNLAPAAVGLNPFTGRGWTERVLDLLEQHGPFSLAWMETLLRAADQRASRQTIIDPLLERAKSS